jgi:hypothetical protein
MSKYRNRVAKLSGLAVLGLFAFGTTQAGAQAIWNGVTPAPNDSTSWSGLGADGTGLTTFSAPSTGGNAVSGSFAGATGLVAIDCPASPSCSWSGSAPFVRGETLVWAFNPASGSGTGPLTLGLSKAVLAGGLDLRPMPQACSPRKSRLSTAAPPSGPKP